MSLEETLIEVWRQAFAENAKAVVLGNERFPILVTSKRKLRQVDFQLEGKQIRGLEQNPATKSRWAKMARTGKKVMQFLSEGRYVANVVDGKVSLYGKRAARLRQSTSRTPYRYVERGLDWPNSHIPRPPHL